jgi:uncharacterized protein YndB with AHSA1/START domain
MTMPTSHRLQITRWFDSPPEKVFKAWTDPEALKVFHAPADAFSVPTVEVDLRVGGHYRIEMRAPDGSTHIATGAYREIRPPDRLVFTWSWEKGGTPDGSPDDSGETVVTLELRKKENGTELALTHDLFPAVEQQERHLHGWTGIVHRLEGFLRSA